MSAGSQSPWWKRLLTLPFLVVAAVVVLVEDWLWDDLQRLAAAIGRLPVFRQLEGWAGRLPPYGALCLFAAPSLLLLPVKLVALYLMSHGKASLGVGVVIAAKLAGTALVARIFSLTRPKLLTLAWFAWLYEKVVAFKSRLYAAIKATKVYQVVHGYKVRLRDTMRAWLGTGPGFFRRHFDAARRRLRKR
jgi:hypothetical protein